MVDTARDLAALLTLFADNTTGAISPQDLRDWTVTHLGCYGDMYVAGGSTAQTGIGTSYVKVTGWASSGNSDNVTVDPTTNNRLIPSIAGEYLMGVSMSFSGSVSTLFTFSAYVNQVEAAEKIVCCRTIGTGGDTGNTATTGIVTLAADDQVELYVKADGAAKSITPVDCRMWLRLIG